MFSHIASKLRGKINPLYSEREAILKSGGRIVDLISGNVNQQGTVYPQETLNKILAHAARKTRVYHPDPLGQHVAREAIQAYYQKRGLRFPTGSILLTPGTSISYWYCFQLLANPGDEILCPKPSYPLFDQIASLCGVRLSFYRLNGSRDQTIDLTDLEAHISAKTRAMILISPHNPTGTVVSHTELEGLAKLAARHRLPIIADEVFSEFLFGIDSLPRPAATRAPLVITLNGFSKMFALPSMKIGWMAFSGEEALVDQSMESLEMISDTFLPVGEIQQFAVPEIFRQGETFLQEFVERIRTRRAIALEMLSKSSRLYPIPPQGGFYLSVRMEDPDCKLDEEQIAIDLLRKTGTLVHPGFFYDLDPPHFVMSFVSNSELLRKQLRKVVDYF